MLLVSLTKIFYIVIAADLFWGPIISIDIVRRFH